MTEPDPIILPINVQTAVTHEDFLRDSGLVHVTARMLASPEVHVPVTVTTTHVRPTVTAVLADYLSRAYFRFIGGSRLQRRLHHWARHTEEHRTTGRASQRLCPHVPLAPGITEVPVSREDHVRWLVGDDDSDG